MVMALQHFAWFVPLFFLIERKNFPLLIFSSFSVIFGLVHFAVKGNFIRFLSFNFSMWLMYVFFFFAWVFFFFSLVKHIRIIKSQPDLN
jgi:hypothetical protein